MPSRTARRWGVQLEDIDLRNQLETLIGSNQKELAEKKKKKTAETHEEDNREDYSFSANVGGEEARSSLSYEYSSLTGVGFDRKSGESQKEFRNVSCQLIVEVGERHDALEARISASEVDLCPLDLEYSIKATLRRFSLAHLFAEWKQNQKKKVLIQCEPKLRGKEREVKFSYEPLSGALPSVSLCANRNVAKGFVNDKHIIDIEDWNTLALKSVQSLHQNSFVLTTKAKASSFQLASLSQKLKVKCASLGSEVSAGWAMKKAWQKFEVPIEAQVQVTLDPFSIKLKADQKKAELKASKSSEDPKLDVTVTWPYLGCFGIWINYSTC
mmetsp:Transcript_6286/g.11519  ORF Transcript_6286/g.11519 Transcript_6286/m.11519 type:complete len:327 (+) Transcript_6286:51-1031(+)